MPTAEPPARRPQAYRRHIRSTCTRSSNALLNEKEHAAACAARAVAATGGNECATTCAEDPSAQPLLFGIGNFGASRHPARSQGNALTIGPRAFHIAAPITFCNGESGCHRVFQGHSVLDTKKCAFACRCTGRAWRQPPVTHWTRVRTFGPIMIWSAPRVDGSDPL